MRKEWCSIDDAAGFSLVEALIASAVLSLMVTIYIGAMIYGQESTLNAGLKARAQYLAEEGFAGIDGIRDGAWNDLNVNQSGLATTGNTWSLLGESTSETIDVFTRTMTFTAVCRNTLGNIATCPADHTDPHTKQVTVAVSWSPRVGGTKTVTESRYFTNWNSLTWEQTDWVGGSGQTTWSDTTKYDSDDSNVDIYTNTGEVILSANTTGTWNPGTGAQLTDETDTNFTGGTTSGTVVSGSGNSAVVQLAQTQQWAAHADSGVPTTQDINEINAVTASDMWGVASAGEIIHYNGTNWSLSTDLGANNLNDIDMLSASSGWLAGASGTLASYNGTTWSLYAGNSTTHTTDTDFNAGSFSSTTVTGTGASASVVLTQSNVWAEHVNSGVVAVALNDIAVVASNDIWSVGNSGKFLHYNGATWSEFTDTGGDTVFGIDAVAANDIWAVGASGKVWHYNGATWSEFTDTGATTMDKIDMISAASGWATGSSGKFWEYAGGVWTEVQDVGGTNLNDIQMTSAADGWAVGGAGEIYRYNGATWSLNQDTGGQTWQDVVIIDATHGWVVGSGGAIYSWNGATWSAAVSPVATALSGVSAVTTTDVWATGSSGKILHYNGVAWSEFVDTGGQTFDAVHMVDANNGWIVGDAGDIFYYSNNYVATGTFSSSVIDSGASGTIWNTASWSETLPAGSDVTIATRTGNTATPDGTWSAFSAEVTTPAGSTITSPTGRYLQYRTTLTRATDPSQTSQLNNITIARDIPTAQSLNGIDVITVSNVWAVGNTGTIIQYNGTTWQPVTSPVTQDLRDVYALSSSDIWAVGASGKILHYNGTSWSEFVDTGAQDWRALYMVTATDGWVVGDGGTIFHYNGTSWSTVTSPVGSSLFSIKMVSASDGWIGGATGKILHWNGTSWSETIDTGAMSWLGIAFTSSTAGFAVGSSGTIEQYASFYNTTGTFESRIFNTGSISSDYDSMYWTESLLSGADLTVATRTGNTATPDGTWTAYSAERTDPVSSDIPSANGQYIQYRITLTRGTTPTQTPTLDNINIIYNVPTSQEINDLDIVANNDVWAGANSGVFLHYNGTTWTQNVDLGVDDVLCLDMITATDGWAAGSSYKVWHWNGTAWSESTDFGTGTIQTIFAVTANNVWAAGSSGKIWHWNGTSWAEFTDAGGMTWRDMHMVTPTDGWVVGDSGEIYHYNGTSWALFVDTGTEDWSDIHMVTATDGWVVGNGGVIRRYNGTAWNTVTSPTSANLKGLDMLNANSGTATGATGTIIQWNGTSWSTVTSPTTKQLNDVEIRTTRLAWAAGATGTIITFSGTPVSYPAEGFLTSSAFNMTDNSPVQVVEWDENLSACTPNCNVQLQVRTAPDSAGSPGTWTGWYGATGLNTYFDGPYGDVVPTAVNGNRWVQYRLRLTTTVVATPALQKIRINYK